MISIHVVAGILQRSDTLLIAERPPGKPYSGYWEFPGGKIEANESGAQALQRELHEELGINVIASQHLFTHEYSYPDKHVKLEVWLVTEFEGEPYRKESQELRWLTHEEMMQLPMLEGNWPIMDKVKPLLIS